VRAQARRRVLADCLLLALGAGALAASLAGGHSAGRLLLDLCAFCLLPGGAVLTRLECDGLVAAAALAVAISFCVEGAGALVMVWSGWWHPFGFALVLLLAAEAALAADLRQRLRARGATP
jgi:hypothetical protein